jgi:hypothetical protein
MSNNSSIEKRQSFVSVFRWILAIILSGFLTLGSAVFTMHYSGIINQDLSGFKYWLFFFAVPIVAFALFVFLTCAFVPSKKMYAASLVILLSLLFIGYGAYEHYTYDGFLSGKHITIYTGFIMGMAVGFMLAYKKYKNNNWG